MTRHQDGGYVFSRRTFLRKMRWTPLLFLPAPFHASPLPSRPPDSSDDQASALPLPEFHLTPHLTPHYPAKSPIEDLLRLVPPGADEYITESYAYEISQLLGEWSRALRAAPPALAGLTGLLDPAMEAASLLPMQENTVRSGSGIEILRRRFSTKMASGRGGFLDEMKSYLAPMSRIDTATFEVVAIKVVGTNVVGIKGTGVKGPGVKGADSTAAGSNDSDLESEGSSPTLHIDIRYSLAGARADIGREERIGLWLTQWRRDESKAWRALRWQATEETLSRSREPIFVDITSQAVGHTESYKNQLLHGVDYWRTVLDGACGIDVYGNNGVAVGDFDGDGRDDIYVCQPAGLPNRLYRNCGDGTFEDVTEKSGVGVLDATACALFADFENKGLQDLLVVCGSGPLLFLNQGSGKFLLKRDAFKFVRPPQGTFTHAAIADYDGDGRLDIYFCLYSYYLGLDQYHYPTPYFDARNGPPNFLFHNEGNATFQDQTEAAGLNVDNDRYSFACAWGDFNSDGSPDLYVVNDFGRSNLYRNNNNGTFTVVSKEAGVEDVGAGMSACWFDLDNDGNQDLYAANMWSAAGIRVSEQKRFHEEDPEDIRELFRQHARGNSFYRNLGDGTFKNVSSEAGVAMGRWAWSSDAWDFDHDGYADLYIANGYVSGPASGPDTSECKKGDLSSFFWRQLVAKSPRTAKPSLRYEQGWSAVNELIRADNSWSGCERNVFYANNHDGTFSEVSGTVGMDFPEDSRAFALADLDHDGRLEVVLKNRSAPQLRILRNAAKELGNSITFRLRGTKSNRDAIGAAVTVEAADHLQTKSRQTKYLQAGSGFLSQHTKELFFGLGRAEGTIHASIRWPSGLTQSFEHLPVNQRIEIQEGTTEFVARPFANSPLSYAHAGQAHQAEILPTSVETWLIEPLRAPEFSLPDLADKIHELRSYRGAAVLLNFGTAASPSCREQLQLLQQYQSKLAASGLRVASVVVDGVVVDGVVVDGVVVDGVGVGSGNVGNAITDVAGEAGMRAFAAKEGLTFPTLLATQEVCGVYNIVYRYLFDRRRDLGLPTSFLINQEGMIVKVYQGSVNPEHLMEDANSIPSTPTDRMRRALPFGGTLHLDAFQRNAFTYGVAFFQHGYLEQAEASFQQVIAAKPDNPEAHYNLGTLYLRRNALPNARQYLERTVKLRPNYPEAWNNLGMIAAQEGQTEEAIRSFRQSLLQRPDYAIALLNLGNFYRRQGSLEESEKLLRQALELEPDNPEVNYNLGMLYVRQEHLDRALYHLEKAVDLRPDYADALNNLGVFFVREKHYAQAEERFKASIRVAPNFDQAYLNLAHLYVILNNKEKAKEILQVLLQQQPQHKGARQSLDILTRGERPD